VQCNVILYAVDCSHIAEPKYTQDN